jgi:TonB family protein
MNDPFLEYRVRDLLNTARQRPAGEASDCIRSAMAAVEDALALDPGNQTALRLRQEIADVAAERVATPAPVAVAAVQNDARSVEPPAFELIPEGETPRLASALGDRPGYLPEPELLSIRDETPKPEKRDLLPILAVILALAFAAVGVRVTWYYLTRRVDLGPNPLEHAQVTPPPNAVPTQGPPPDDTIYYADSGVTLPVLRSKYEPHSDTAGKVVLLAVIAPDGHPVNATVWRGLTADLNVQALRAAEKWRFAPGTKNGKAVPVIAQIEVNFRQ